MEEHQLRNRVELLKKTNVFSEIDDLLLAEIAPVLTDVKINKQQNIIRKGERGDAMYIITKGLVRIHDGNHVISRLRTNDVFGEYSLIDDQVRSASVTAEEPTELLSLSRKDFEALVSGNIEMTRGILRVLIQRIRYMNELEEKLTKSYLKIQRQKQEIEEQSENIKEQKQKLEEQNFDLLNVNEEKNHLISIVVHGLKNPLTSSLCMTDFLELHADELPEEYRECIDIIHNSLQRMNKMINQVLDVNVIESKVIQLKYEKINLSKIINEIYSHHKQTIQQKELNVILDLDDAFAELNEVYILQVVDNLLSNAIKFTQSGKIIWIKLHESKDKVSFVIRDEGVGIPKEQVDDIFDIYQRKKHHLKQDEPDPGLGLAIVRKYVTAMNGKVWCKSDKGKGAAFYVEFDKAG